MTQEKGSDLSRRDFGRKAAVGATALASFSVLKSYGANDDAMKIGLIGCGGRGNGAVKNAIQASSNVKLVAVHDIVEKKAKDTVANLKENAELSNNIAVDDNNIFSGVDGYKKLLKEDLDYVILATPPGFRPMHFEACVEAGKNMFCEKPVATDPVGIRRFILAARKSELMGLSVVTGTQRRHQGNYVQTIQQIHDGVLGELLTGRAYWNGGLPFARERTEGMSDLEYQASHNWYNFCWICGDNIVEQHIHNLDIMNWVFQSHPVAVTASGGRAWKPNIEKYGNIFDHFSCDYEYPNGVHVLSMSRHWDNAANNVSEAIVGTKGTSSCNDMGKTDVDPYVQEHIDLQASIRGSGCYLNEGVRVAESTFTAIIGRMSAYTGQRLTWHEALDSDLDILPKELDFKSKIPVDPIPNPGFRA